MIRSISVVNLKRCLGMPDDAKTEGLFIITNFNKLNIAFHVDAVLGIHRVSWEAIIKPDATINTEQNSASTGVIKMDDKLIIILDFEKDRDGHQPGDRTEDVRYGRHGTA